MEESTGEEGFEPSRRHVVGDLWPVTPQAGPKMSARTALSPAKTISGTLGQPRGTQHHRELTEPLLAEECLGSSCLLEETFVTLQ